MKPNNHECWLYDHGLDPSECMKILKTLPRRLQDVIYKRLWEGMTYIEIGKFYGVTKQRAWQLFDQGITIIRKELED